MPITINTQHKQNKGKASDEKKKKKKMQDLKSVTGQISWLAGISRPYLSFENCILSTSQTKATVNDLIRANKILSSAKNHEYEITFSKLNQANLPLAVFDDASFRNLLDRSSEGGFIVFLANNVGNSNPLIWASKKIKRAVK